VSDFVAVIPRPMRELLIPLFLFAIIVPLQAEPVSVKVEPDERLHPESRAPADEEGGLLNSRRGSEK
jgi:hypothetical protein